MAWSNKLLASISLFLMLTLCVDFHVNAYEVPAAKIDVYYPKGFEVSIPDEPGITLFAFHGKLNEEMEGLEAGTWARDIVKAKNGRWTFRDKITQLKIGDTLYYWTYVIYNGLGYREDDGVYVVRGYANSTMPGVVIPGVSSTGGSNGGSGGKSGHCLPSATVMNGGIPVACSGQIIFKDEFSGSHLDTQQWKLERRFSTQPDYEFVMYLDDVPDVVTLRSGMVTIAPKPTEYHFRSAHKPLVMEHNLGARCTGSPETEECYRNPTAASDIVPPFISAQFSTKNKFSFKYGRIEIKAKLPCIEWAFPQLWLQPVENIYGFNNYQSGQMRIAFSRVNATGIQLYGGVLLNAKEPWRSAKMCHAPQAADWGNDFHVYQLTWTENFIAVAVDGIEYCRFTSDAGATRNLRAPNGEALPNLNKLEEGTDLAPFDQEFYITLGYGIGGNHDFKDDLYEWKNPKPWTNADPKVNKKFWKSVKNDINQWLGSDDLRIDYVYVYAA